MAEFIPTTIPPLSQTRDEQTAQFLSLVDRLSEPQQELLLLVLRAFGPVEVPDGPDADLIRLSQKMFNIQEATTLAYEVIPEDDDEQRAIVLKPLNAKWLEAKAEFFKLEAPTTAAGARSLAWVLLDQYPQGVEEAIQDDNLATWLAIRCAEYLDREEPEIGFGT